jgi:hypothetical protein
MPKTAKHTPHPGTRAARLDRVVERVAPKAFGKFRKAGGWTGTESGGAPYTITTTPDGGRRILVTGDDGDVISGVGPNIEAALKALEGKIR